MTYININGCGTKRIQIIKLVRTATGMELREAKNFVDFLENAKVSVDFDDFHRYSNDASQLVKDFWNAGADNVYQGPQPAYSICSLSEFKRKDEEEKEPTPLTIDQLALKLAMRGLTVEQVRSLANALTGIEDASGSLNEAAKRMKEVE